MIDPGVDDGFLLVLPQFLVEGPAPAGKQAVLPGSLVIQLDHVKNIVDGLYGGGEGVFLAQFQGGLANLSGKIDGGGRGSGKPGRFLNLPAGGDLLPHISSTPDGRQNFLRSVASRLPCPQADEIRFDLLAYLG